MIEIDRDAFNSFEPQRAPTASAILDERAWFKKEDDSMIGVVGLDKFDHDWSWVLMGRDTRGKFRAVDMGVSFASMNLAVRQLKKSAKRHKGSVFPQGDEQDMN